MKKYSALKENRQNATHLKIELRYSKGGMNYFTYQHERRGYYLMITPVERKDYGNGLMMEGMVVFSGIKKLLKEVKRQSAKAEAEAESMVEQSEHELIEYVLNKNGLELA